MPACLRLHRGLEYFESGREGPRLVGKHPAMVAQIRGRDGEMKGIHRTYLDADGTGKAGVASPKKCLGKKRGGLIQLTEATTTLGLTEGIETGLAVYEATGMAVAAAIDAGNLPTAELPGEVRRLFIWADGDEVGRARSLEAGNEHARAGREVCVLAPPGDGKRDWLDVLVEDGPDALVAAVEKASPIKPPAGPVHGKAGAVAAGGNNPTRDGALPEVVLPKDGFPGTLSDAGGKLARLFAGREDIFCRTDPNGIVGRGQVQALYAGHGLSNVGPAQACSLFEKVARLVSPRLKDGEPYLLPGVCSETLARRILASDTFLAGLPPLCALLRCPALIERDGELRTISGYDRTTGIFANGDPPLAMTVNEARVVIDDLVAEMPFATAGDRSRYLANLITPALVLGGVGGFRAPIQFHEAEESQSGKGLLHQITAAIYGDVPATVGQNRGGGLGSLREKLDEWLIQGRTFVNLDNLTATKGDRFDCEELCSFMTESTYLARALRKSAPIDPARHVVMVTTNGCTLSADLANRANPVRLRKEHGQRFRMSKEQFVAHTRRHAAVYLGAIFALARAWHEAGKPRTASASQDTSFREWWCVLDWIVVELLGAASLSEGLEDVKARLTSPDQMWLRNIARAVEARGEMGLWLATHRIADICAGEGVALPGVKEPDAYLGSDEDSKRVLMGLGAKLHRCFHGQEREVLVDSFRVETAEHKSVGPSGKPFKQHVYRFWGHRRPKRSKRRAQPK